MNSLIVVGAQRPVRQRVPDGVETSEGRDAVALAALAGLELDEWQAWLLRHSLAVRDGRWAAFEVGLIVPRQNGKGALLEARQLAGLFLTRDPLQVHSAHEFKTSFEHFVRITQMIERCPDLDRRVMRIRRGAGEQAVELKDGCRLRFLARSTGSGRGLTGDTVYLDEAFALTTPMMGALLPTLSAVPNPQVWYTSSAPMRSSTVLHGVRERGRAEDGSDRLLYAEWGLDAEADIENPDNWALSNPALGIRLTEESIRAELDALRSMPDEFRRERLGVAQGDSADDSGHVIDPAKWAALADPESRIASHRSFALDVSPDWRWATIAAAGRRADQLLHLEAFDTRPGTEGVVAAGRQLWQRWRVPIRVQTGSPAASFVGDLRAAGVTVTEVSTQDHAAAVGQLIVAVSNGTVHHMPSKTLDAAVANADVRPVGDVELWARRQARVNITPIVACTLALGGVPLATQSYRPRKLR